MPDPAMVLGLRSKRRTSLIYVEYSVHLLEIKPWPLKTLKSVVLQWENGDRSSGSSSAVVPSPDDGKIVIGESFKLRTVFQRAASSGGSFQKNLLELNLYEVRGKAARGQHLAGAAVDLAEHGVIREPVGIALPLTCRRSFRSGAQPVLFLRIQPFSRSDGGVNGGEEELAAFTDDDSTTEKSEILDEDTILERSYSDVALQSMITRDPRLSKSVRSPSIAGRSEDSLEELKEIDVLDQTDHESRNLKSRESSFSDRMRVETEESEIRDEDVKLERSSSDVLPESVITRDSRLSKSVRLLSIVGRSHNSSEELKDVDVLDQTDNNSKNFKDRNSSFSDRMRVIELEARVEAMEAELRCTAAVEIATYAVVAEHGSSAQKVHAPARRLLRLYNGNNGAARSAASALVSVAKACGNDVPRLTFWLSNAIVLRAAVTEGIDPLWSKSNAKDLSLLRWESLTNVPSQRWEDQSTFVAALEKIEGSIFSRIVESLWWQTLTPRMHALGRVDENQGRSPIRLWREAFREACERLCPVRANGHDCGCLHTLPKLIMEQCVARLDVALFNALLREPGDELPADPISDPITDLRVLPIAAAQFSFGAGAQLKNTIGNWSRGLSHWFGIDDESAEGEEEGHPREKKKLFRLLNALSDLLMLPKDMLVDQSIRREVCPIFGALVLRRVLSRFEPDEFCPESIPNDLLDLLDSEGESPEMGTFEVESLPYATIPVVYTPPPAATVSHAIGSAAIFRKSYTSDDELDELVNADTSFPLTSGAADGGEGPLRYQLLRQLWRRND